MLAILWLWFEREPIMAKVVVDTIKVASKMGTVRPNLYVDQVIS